MSKKKYKISVIGMGYVGLPTAIGCIIVGIQYTG